MTRRSIAVGVRFLALAALVALDACASPDHIITLDDPEEAQEFQQSLGQYATSVDQMLQDTQKGQNVSEFSMGMLSYNILMTVSSTDKSLHDYFNSGGQDIQDYLKTRFQDHPEQELEALDRMSARGTYPLRSSARYTLEALTHIPDAHDPPAVQQQSRAELAVALERTKSSLTEAAEEVRASK